MTHAPLTHAPRTTEERTRSALEITTAILLGLVSVATAVGAYQAGAWAQQASDLASISQQARDRNLALYLEKDAASDDDGERLFDAFALEAEAVFYPERADRLRADEEVLIAAGSAPLVEGWAEWRDDGFPADQIPLLSPAYEAFSQAEPQSYNLISRVSDDSSHLLLERAHAMTVVSVLFAAALLFLGIAGVSARLNVSAVMTGGGALAFLVGVIVVIFGVF
ncbi:hypothetical protein BH11ACT3_BH11ACT3_04060 [soil metagenome]